jgi:hypothetical protein
VNVLIKDKEINLYLFDHHNFFVSYYIQNVSIIVTFLTIYLRLSNFIYNEPRTFKNMNDKESVRTTVSRLITAKKELCFQNEEKNDATRLSIASKRTC